MMITWKLISYSEVELPHPSEKTGYIVGIAENSKKERLFVRINRVYSSVLRIKMKGQIESGKSGSKIINIFNPLVKKKQLLDSRRVALVTGSSTGIGKAIAIELARNGIDVIVNSHTSLREGREVSREIKNIGRRSLYIQANVADPVQVEQMIEKIITKFGHIDILISNSGVTADKRFDEMTIDHWNKVISVNLTGTFNCTKTVIKYMKKQQRGKIINISSVIGEMGNIGQANYAAAKGGIISFTKSIAKEYSSEGITVNAVTPGFIKTRMVEILPKNIIDKIINDIPLGRLGNPEEIAKVVAFLVSKDADYITGQVIRVNGGLYI